MWIEILKCLKVSMTIKSRPARALWIEIPVVKSG